MRAFFKIVLIAAVFGLVSCEKINQPYKNANWWVRQNFDYTGIKSIEGGSYIIYGDGRREDYNKSHHLYNRNGTLASVTSDSYDISYTYNSDGTYNIIETIYKTDVKQTRLLKFEYNNPGRYVPLVLYPEEPFNLHMDGLIPNLSKITEIYDGEITKTAVFSFDEDCLTISISKSGKEPYEPIVVEYHGAYPYQCRTERFFFGPITYQENGMFDTITEGSIRNGEVTSKTTYYFIKGRNDKLLCDRYEENNEENNTVWVFTYNEYGDLIKSEYGDMNGKEYTVWGKTDYEYDARGNWTDRKATEKSFDQWTWQDAKSLQYRIIEYY